MMGDWDSWECKVASMILEYFKEKTIIADLIDEIER